MQCCGQLSNGKYDLHFRNCDKPRLIEALKTKRIRDIACGSSHSAAITSSGELYSWGLGEYGRLGHGDNTTQLRPKLVRQHLPPHSSLYFTGTLMGIVGIVMGKIMAIDFMTKIRCPKEDKNVHYTD